MDKVAQDVSVVRRSITSVSAPRDQHMWQLEPAHPGVKELSKSVTALAS